MSHLNLVQGLGPVLQIAEGYTVELPEKVHRTLDLRTNATWPTTWFAPRLTGQGPFQDVYSVMNNWGANHGAISHGHIGDLLIALAAILRIPVCMHNVPGERLFRPAPGRPSGAQDPRGLSRLRGVWTGVREEVSLIATETQSHAELERSLKVEAALAGPAGAGQATSPCPELSERAVPTPLLVEEGSGATHA